MKIFHCLAFLVIMITTTTVIAATTKAIPTTRHATTVAPGITGRPPVPPVTTAIPTNTTGHVTTTTVALTTIGKPVTTTSHNNTGRPVTTPSRTTPRSATTIPPRAHNITTSSAATTTTPVPIFRCHGNGKYPDPSDCHFFFECVYRRNSYLIERRACLLLFAFSPQLGDCLFTFGLCPPF